MKAIPTLVNRQGRVTKVDEGEHAKLSGRFYDVEGEPFNIADLVAVSVSIRHESLSVIVNEVSGLDIFNTNDGRVYADGSWEWYLSPADNVVLNRDGSENEKHIIEVAWTYRQQTGDPRSGVSPHRQLLRPKNRMVDLVLRSGRITDALRRGSSYVLPFIVERIEGEQPPTGELALSDCTRGDALIATVDAIAFDAYYWQYDFALSTDDTEALREGMLWYDVRSIRGGDIKAEFDGQVQIR